MVIKMTKHHMDTHHNQFSYNIKDSAVSIYKTEQISLPVTAFLFSFRRESLSFNHFDEAKNEKIRAEKVNSIENTQETANI